MSPLVYPDKLCPKYVKMIVGYYIGHVSIIKRRYTDKIEVNILKKLKKLSLLFALSMGAAKGLVCLLLILSFLHMLL